MILAKQSRGCEGEALPESAHAQDSKIGLRLVKTSECLYRPEHASGDGVELSDLLVAYDEDARDATLQQVVVVGVIIAVVGGRCMVRL